MGITWKNLAVLSAALAASTFWIGLAPAHEDANFPMPRSKTFVNECGGCHTAYAPGLLPARSWRKMMAELHDHFGEDASVDEAVRLGLLKDLVDLSADASYGNTLMRRIAGSIPASTAPQRISETPFFRYMHDEVPNSFWKRKAIGTPANCIACHPRANDGRYGEDEVRIPK